MPKVSDDELKQREAALSAEIRRLLPDFVESCRNNERCGDNPPGFRLLPTPPRRYEYALLGKAIKFAGLHGKELRIIGTTGKLSRNRETELVPINEIAEKLGVGEGMTGLFDRERDA